MCRFLACTFPLICLFLGKTAIGQSAHERDFDAERRASSIAIGAKLLASGLFVSGMDQAELLEIDLRSPYYFFHEWDETTVTIDPIQQSVTLSAPGLRPRTARFFPGLGAILLPADAEEIHFPLPEFPTAKLDPEALWPQGSAADPLAEAARQGVDGPALQQLLQAALEPVGDPVPHRNRALVVIRNGALIGEAHAPGFTPETAHLSWSMGKSLAATLIGTLIQENLQEPPPIPEWRTAADPRKDITLLDLLRMSGGLQFRQARPGDPIYYTPDHDHESVYFEAKNTASFVTSQLLQFVPGTTWRYRNTDTLSLMAIYRSTLEAAGRNPLTYPQTDLLHRIGATSFTLEPDPWGNFIISGYVYASARDWARLGLLYLRQGDWFGEQILPENWDRILTFPAPALAPQRHYGGQFWLNLDGRLPSVPRDAYFALGWLGQYLLIIPSLDVVIVRMGFSDYGSEATYFDSLFREILSVLPPPTSVSTD